MREKTHRIPTVDENVFEENKTLILEKNVFLVFINREKINIGFHW